MSTPRDAQPTDGPAGDLTVGGERPAQPVRRDWHTLAPELSGPPAVRPRSSRSRARSGPRPGQLAFDDLLAPAPEADQRGGLAPVPGRLEASGPSTADPGVATDRGVLVSGRFPVRVDAGKAPGTGGADGWVRPVRPGDWSGLGVVPETVPFELPPPAVPEDDARPATLPVYSSQVLERRLIGLRAGQTVEVEPGEYRGTLTIRTPVVLRATGGEVRIRSTVGPAVVLKGCGSELSGLTIRSDKGEALIVESRAGRSGPVGGRSPQDDHLELTDCCVSGAGGGIVLGTALVRLGLDRCVVIAGDGDAITLPFRAVAVIAGSEITSRSGHGITGGAAMTLGLVGTTISGCGGAGIRLEADAKLWMDDGAASTITGNHGSGIALGPGASGALGASTLTGNGGWGLIAPGGDLSVRAATFAGNALGDAKLG